LDSKQNLITMQSAESRPYPEHPANAGK